MPAKDVVVTPVVEKVTYTISYELNGGTNGNNPATYDVESGAIELADPTREGYTFL